MHLQEININKFRMLRDVSLRFVTPESKRNVVNVIAGVNGCGKTSVLEAIFLLYDDRLSFLAAVGTAKQAASVEHFQLIYLPTSQSLPFNAVTQLSKTYRRVRQINSQEILGQAESYIKEFVLSHERRSSLSDPKARTQAAVAAFNHHFLEAEMLTQLVDLSADNYNRPVFRNVADELVTIDQLSDGEKQLYGRVVALLMLEPKNALILIDEPDIALHPTWQQKIMQIYSQIGEDNQFVVTTHSPQIIAHTPYQNLILLQKQGQNIVPLYPANPPTGVDVNSILSEMMGVTQAIPADVAQLQRRYRELLNQEQENSAEAEQVKQQLLTRESNDSKFMQEMRLLLRLRGRK